MQLDALASAAVLARCLRRTRRWPPPPNWSPGDWLEEVRGCAALAMCQAAAEYDSLRGKSIEAFMIGRATGAVLTRYRQEWAYAGHCIHAATHDPRYAIPSDGRRDMDLCLTAATLEELLDRLPETDRLILRQMFWDCCTEADLAGRLGISQQAVSKRKDAVLRSLRAHLQS